MNDVILTLDLSNMDEDSLLSGALDAFVSSKVDAGRPASDAPDMMVRTMMSPAGRVRKQLIFQDQKWADAFLSFWEDQKMQMSAA